jgi:hypothetical protein
MFSATTIVSLRESSRKREYKLVLDQDLSSKVGPWSCQINLGIRLQSAIICKYGGQVSNTGVTNTGVIKYGGQVLPFALFTIRLTRE